MSSNDDKTEILLMLANKIMEGLNQDIVIEDISYLFDDDFYVTILSNILRNIDPVIGNTKDEKAENLNNLVQNLSQIVDMDLSDINGYGIIFEEDRRSVRKLLELILEIIYTMNDANGSEQNDAISNTDKILSDSNINNNFNNNNYNEEDNSELNNFNSNNNTNLNNYNSNNRESQLQNQILTSHSNSNFYVNESRDSQIMENEDENKNMKSTNRSNKISNSQSGSYNNMNPNTINNNLKNSKSNGFSNNNLNNNLVERNNENLNNEKNPSNRNKVNNINNNLSDKISSANEDLIKKQKQFYDLADHQLTNENLEEKQLYDIVNHYENDVSDNNIQKNNMFINEQAQADLTQEENTTEGIPDRLNYSCIEFNFDDNRNEEDHLSLNYLCNVLIQNNINLEDIHNINSLSQIDFLKSFSKKAILSRKLNYSVSDADRYFLEKNDLQILIDFIANQENPMNNQENITGENHHQQSIEDFTSMLAGEHKNKISNKNFHKNPNQLGDESKSINISRISEVSRDKENSDQFSNQKYKKNMSTSSKSNQRNFKKSDDSSNAKLNSNSNLFKSSDGTNNVNYNNTNLMNNNQNFSSNYNSQQDSYQPSKMSYNNTNNINSNMNYNSESKIDESKNIQKNLAKNQIKELQSLGSYENPEEELEEENNENQDNYNQINMDENDEENEMENQGEYEEENEPYDYVNHTDSMDMNRINMEMNNINKNNLNNNNIIIQNDYINSKNQQKQIKGDSQKSLGNKSGNKSSNRPSTANIRPSSSNKANNNSMKKNINNNKMNNNPYFNNNNKIHKNNSGLNDKKNSNAKNVNRINSSKPKIGKNVHSNNKNNMSKSEMSMSSIHSISQNNSKIQNSNNKNYKNNNSKNIQNNNRINNNHLINNNFQNLEENEDMYNQNQMFDENGQLIQNYQEGNEIIEENEAEEFANDENLKEDILREFKRIYGNKVDKMLLRSQLQQSTNILELILQNVKLARNKMIKLATSNQDPDDLATKEFFMKYTKELNYIVNTVKEEEKKRNKFITKAVKNISHNSNVMKKLQNIEAKRIEDEINRRRKSRDLKLRDNRMRICEEIYSKALELEKNKHLQERQAETEYRKAENLEKRKKLMQIESYYQDRINILRDTLRREKYEKELEYRANIQYVSKLQRERRSELKKQIDEIFTRMDEEDRKYEFKNSRPDVLEKILNIYYNN